MPPTSDSPDRTLRDLLRADGRLSFGRAAEILAGLANALVPYINKVTQPRVFGVRRAKVVAR